MANPIQKALAGQPASTYAWAIDREYVDDSGEYLPPNKGIPFGPVHGPSDAPDSLLARLQADSNSGWRFRLYDDDGGLNLTGRILTLSGEAPWDEDDEVAFAPLHDYGEGGYGCTALFYQMGNNMAWEQL